MTITVEGKNVNLVQVTNDNTGFQAGLYFVPYNVTMDEMQYAIEKAEDQDDFDSNNNLGIQRVYAYDMIADLKF